MKEAEELFLKMPVEVRHKSSAARLLERYTKNTDLFLWNLQ